MARARAHHRLQLNPLGAVPILVPGAVSPLALARVARAIPLGGARS